MTTSSKYSRVLGPVGMSLFFGADTGIGPLYFGLTHAPRGSTGITLFLGRP